MSIKQYGMLHLSKYGSILSICRTPSSCAGECRMWEEEARLGNRHQNVVLISPGGDENKCPVTPKANQ